MTKRKKTPGTKSELEKLAQDMFERYSIDFIGTKANWDYLGKTRQLAWMKEAYYFSRFTADKVREHINKPTSNNPAQTSYEMGYLVGMKNERMSLMDMLQKLDDSLEQQLEDFEIE